MSKGSASPVHTAIVPWLETIYYAAISGNIIQRESPHNLGRGRPAELAMLERNVVTVDTHVIDVSGEGSPVHSLRRWLMAKTDPKRHKRA
ncbi:hypothetical protein AFCA_010851 [Aspergillus flavus]|nr:hypothetical protein AFCA_010851 [Aspergillus flavus]